MARPKKQLPSGTTPVPVTIEITRQKNPKTKQNHGEKIIMNNDENNNNNYNNNNNKKNRHQTTIAKTINNE